MVGLDITITPPHPPPLKDEEAPSTSWEVLVKLRCGPTLVKIICWFAAFSELIVISAALVPSCNLSRQILGLLGGKESVDFIHASPLCIMGTALAALGGMIRYSCYRELGDLFTFEMSIKRGHRLVTTGPYSLTRHPGYTGVVCTVVGIAMLHTGPGSMARECGILESRVGMAVLCMYLGLTGFITIGLLGRMGKEDEALKEMFKEEWEGWVRRVPWKLVPGVW
ncbi:hypothetical protein E1B28_000788 [Marasmius oreades]|uniref:Protein-S-isoprenylcysteine O-methyltransferase n=1 Tax=Marasmius oreades TaxID=181124 RepID=A0A9P7V219_9AGAR|nr:uncharacterized protein E1B28_000788 [Marasmius oreades]KAG7098888.1 hypothetical protein E1B28_000788 [Marasmius oreades]